MTTTEHAPPYEDLSPEVRAKIEAHAPPGTVFTLTRNPDGTITATMTWTCVVEVVKAPDEEKR